ncbi:MAG TPA: biopolymer transporter ExbD [Terriglobales bacterium]|nr:biopolymer transporter ExbD [Terriglobales bacterium]
MANRRKHQAQLFSEIDVGTLTSVFAVVALALLIFEMLFFSRALEGDRGSVVELPRFAYSVAMRDALREDAVTITVTRDGKIFVGLHRATTNDLVPLIQERLRSGRTKRIFLKADIRTRYRNIAVVIEALQQAGVGNVALLNRVNL